MKQTQFIRNNAKLQGGRKSPKPKEYERAEDILPVRPSRNARIAEKQIDRALGHCVDLQIEDKCPKCGLRFDGAIDTVIHCPRCGQPGSTACCNSGGKGVICIQCEEQSHD